MGIINRWSKWTFKNITFSVPCESDNSRLYHESELYTSKVFFLTVSGVDRVTHLQRFRVLFFF